MASRLDALKTMLEADAGNVLARYGLATELKNSGDLTAAVAEYERLLTANSNYSAALFHGGQTLEKLGRLDEARAWYERGIAVTTAMNDGHARAEMQAALDLLG